MKVSDICYKFHTEWNKANTIAYKYLENWLTNVAVPVYVYAVCVGRGEARARRSGHVSKLMGKIL